MVRKCPLLIVLCLCLASCAGVQSPAPMLPNFPGHDESVAGEVTNSPGLGVAVLDAGIEGLQCSESHVVLARADIGGHEGSTGLSLRRWNGVDGIGGSLAGTTSRLGDRWGDRLATAGARMWPPALRQPATSSTAIDVFRLTVSYSFSVKR